MVDDELPDSVRQALRRLALHTPLRCGVERVGEARTGGLYVLGWDESVEAVCQGGYAQTGVRVTAEDVKQFSKMDLAVIISADDAYILKAGVRLTPSSLVPSSGSGARHLTAADTAKEIGHPVIAVSEETGKATLYVGSHLFELTPQSVLLSKATLAVLELDSCAKKLSAPDLGQRSAATLAEQARLVLRQLNTILLEFGEEGTHIAELVADYRARLGYRDESPAPWHLPAGVKAMHSIARRLGEWDERALDAAQQTLSVRLAPAERPFPRVLLGDEREVLRWYDKEGPTLVTSIREAVEAGDPATALRRSMAMLEFFYRRKSRGAWLEVTSLAVVAARQVGDKPAEASLLTSMGIALRELGEFGEAVEHFEHALVIWREIQDHAGAADTLNRLAYALDQVGFVDRAVLAGDEALVLVADVSELRLTGMIHNNLAGIHSRAGSDDRAMTHVGTAIDLFTLDEYHRGRAWALSVQGRVHYLAGRYEAAHEFSEEAIAIRSEMGDDYGVALSRMEFGDVLLAQRNVMAAREQWETALDFFSAVDESHARTIRVKLEALDLRRREDR
ncbi:tetratricopeptide repeat protein [Saccharothrix saharensis]|uniref:tetratricopeptide repeat protein n=1 Tax=Saccharothrix saharensis TaxID=571190 RepID=UPI0036AAC278